MTEFIIRIISSIIISIYYVQRFRKYIDNKKNNNVTGDVLFRWESVSIIDKYHLRERFLGGSRLRIKRDPKRREIKYYWLTFIPALALIASSLQNVDAFTYVTALFNLMFVTKLLFDRIEYRKSVSRLVLGLVGMLLTLIGFVIVSGNVLEIKEITQIYKKFIVSGKQLGIQPGMYIPMAVIMLVLIYSIIKRRELSIFVCVSAILATYISVGITEFPKASNYLVINFIGYLYISLIIMQCIYNVRALKKITFIN